ncbi:phosphate uptake regulator [Halohasta litchfieldiae]|jgi:phosphate uptake regulator|uniref:Phosphate uptake regulator n=2 Tax=Halohasta litchfieldiae TaxID=1073996 RepID=A0A1H6TWT0_9EURY|nr:phosphate uptake regulator PhoU [Halohasta litchfieldiae]ATW88898.1 phosphate uptake regulator [Halohasta litchfieldiae]SEI80675.1 Phosphate uptake regulator [Halohasta litchfieldiae]
MTDSRDQSMETRKIQSVGGGTYTVSLPKSWSESEGVTPGETVNVHQHRDGILAIQTQETDSNGPVQSTVRVAHEETARLEQTLRAAYAVGIKELRLVAATEFSADQRRIVDAVAKKLTGVSVVEASETEITVQVLLNRDEVSVSQSVRQLKFIALSMHETAIESLTTGSNAAYVATRDDQVDRLYAMIDRSFARALARLDEVDALGYSRPALFELWETTRELERVADHAEGIATTIPAVDDSVPDPALDEIRSFGQAARTLVDDAVAVIVGDAGAETAHETLLARDELCEQIERYTPRGSTTDGSQLRPVLHRVRRTAEHGGNIAELGLQNAVRHGELTPTPDDRGQQPQ